MAGSQPIVMPPSLTGLVDPAMEKHAERVENVALLSSTPPGFFLALTRVQPEPDELSFLKGQLVFAQRAHKRNVVRTR